MYKQNILKKRLNKLVSCIVKESENNEVFLQEMLEVFGIGDENDTNKTSKSKSAASVKTSGSGSSKRDPAVLDPIALAEKGADVLEAELLKLSEKELKDIITQYGMNQDRAALKWRRKERLINRIMERSLQRASKGDAFR